MRLFALSALGPRESIRFALDAQREGFALRSPDGSVHAYLNVCPHRAQAVDLGDGRLWLPSGQIECSAHGARFEPATGACVGGPCDGRALTPLTVEVRDGALWLAEGALR